jgi:hypothetical protein
MESEDFQGKYLQQTEIIQSLRKFNVISEKKYEIIQKKYHRLKKEVIYLP